MPRSDHTRPAPPRPRVLAGERLTVAGQLGRALLTSGPGVAWLLAFFFLPLLLLLGASFLSRGELGGIELPFTTENYRRLAGFGCSASIRCIRSSSCAAWRWGRATAGLCALAGLPLAFYIAGLPARARNLALVLVMIPFWTNLLIRTYAWQILLAPEAG